MSGSTRKHQTTKWLMACGTLCHNSKQLFFYSYIIKPWSWEKCCCIVKYCRKKMPSKPVKSSLAPMNYLIFNLKLVWVAKCCKWIQCSIISNPDMKQDFQCFYNYRNSWWLLTSYMHLSNLSSTVLTSTEMPWWKHDVKNCHQWAIVQTATARWPLHVSLNFPNWRLLISGGQAAPRWSLKWKAIPDL